MRLKPGECFGEVSFIIDQKRYFSLLILLGSVACYAQKELFWGEFRRRTITTFSKKRETK
jgi:hypothetical protein